MKLLPITLLLMSLVIPLAQAQIAPTPEHFDSGSKSNPGLTDISAAIEELTTIGPDGSGYLADPQPVRLAPSNDRRMQILSGTTKAIIDCAYPISPHCFQWSRLTINAGELKQSIIAAGDAITNIQNVNLFQDDNGAWQAAVTIGIHSRSHPEHWTIVAHAHPVVAGQAGLPPLAWSADTVLSGSLRDPRDGNYDAKYFEDHGRLYLLYVKNFEPRPALRNEIMIQPMLSPTQAAAVAPTVLLTPGDRQGGLASERYARTQAKLVEAPWIVRINGKYALIYSTGAYLTPGYKAGVAWSDTLLPPPGSRYRKVLQPDVRGIWGRPGRLEVRYLVQSEKPRWPNFTAAKVIGPGVAAAVRGPSGVWWLYFNGFAPGDMPLGRNGRVEGSHRRPYALRLRVAVPTNASVIHVSDAELAGWLQPTNTPQSQ